MDMVVHDDEMMAVVDTVQKVVDQVVAEVHGDVMQDDWDHLIDRSKDDREWKNVDDTILLTPTDFSQETYHDRCVDWGEVGGAITAYLQIYNIVTSWLDFAVTRRGPKVMKKRIKPKFEKLSRYPTEKLQSLCHNNATRNTTAQTAAAKLATATKLTKWDSTT